MAGGHMIVAGAGFGGASWLQETWRLIATSMCTPWQHTPMATCARASGWRF